MHRYSGISLCQLIIYVLWNKFQICGTDFSFIEVHFTQGLLVFKTLKLKLRVLEETLKYAVPVFRNIILLDSNPITL